MGQLVNGEWITENEIAKTGAGAFQRPDAVFRNWVTSDGRPGPSGGGGFAAESGRYHLYVSLACPWAHRALIMRKLKGLEEHISVDVVHPDMREMGWTFATDTPGATGDRLFGSEYLHQIYQRAAPLVSTRATVPVLWDKAQGVIVSNESSEIIRMFNSAFDGIVGNRYDYWPQSLRDAIAPVNKRIYDTVNNGVYRCGFARSQVAYDTAVHELFDTLDWLEDRLSRSRYLMGQRITEADWRLATTLFRFDAVYHFHFKASRNRLVEFPNLWAYARELYQWPGIAETVDFDHIVRHYYTSHESINPRRIVPKLPEADWLMPHTRERLAAA